MPKSFVTLCFINFLLAALLGLAMRYSNMHPMDFNYKYVTHAHSHVAMLGWVYLMLYSFMVHYFVPEQKPVYVKLFWITQVAVIGMLLSFPFQGYAAISISFSTLHIFCSYYFAFRLWKDMKIENTLVKVLAKTALAFMLISTLGVWCLGPAIGLSGNVSAFYNIAIQFFLHVQFNGWFLLAVITILFHHFQIEASKQTSLFYRYFIAATVLTFALPVQWYVQLPLLNWCNGLGIVLQLLALYYFIWSIKAKFRYTIAHQPALVLYLYGFALFCFMLKIGLQTLSVLPKLASKLYLYHHFVIGFIHLTMLGVISGFLFAFLLHSKILKPSKGIRFGMYAFLLGFLLTESLLLIQGCMLVFAQRMLPHYDTLLFVASMLLPLGILSILIGYLSPSQPKPKTIHLS